MKVLVQPNTLRLIARVSERETDGMIPIRAAHLCLLADRIEALATSNEALFNACDVALTAMARHAEVSHVPSTTYLQFANQALKAAIVLTVSEAAR